MKRDFFKGSKRVGGSSPSSSTISSSETWSAVCKEARNVDPQGRLG